MEKKILKGLEPQIVWELFEEISKIPRASKKEEKIREWVKNLADKQQISWQEDSVGNILLSVKASKGYEDYPGIILQGHLDMVAQKDPESTHDFDKDPIPIKIENDYVTAEGTTLGADNGIGVAIALAAIKDPNVLHGPINVLLTVDEETGLTGAFQLDKRFLNYKLLLNLDSEDQGKITVSSAGGGDTKFKILIGREGKASLTGFTLTVGGLMGGHSGVDIHRPRFNAIKILTEGLINIRQKVNEFHICSINGGSAHNTIPRDAYCEFLVDNPKGVQEIFIEWNRQIKSYEKNEPKLNVNLQKTTLNTFISSTNTIITLLYEIPHGALSYSKEIPNLVETSNNLALIKTTPYSIEIITSTRSSYDKELNRIRNELKDLGERVGAEVIQGPSYPGWQPELESPFLSLVRQEYTREYGMDVELKAVHGGLETGLFKGIDPELQIVSIGAKIKDAHSPQERVYIESVDVIWRTVKAVLSNINQIKT
ncbi:MAG: beta-Ala-His dipeptidase [Candidatus Thorarchaeota archaeon]